MLYYKSETDISPISPDEINDIVEKIIGDLSQGRDLIIVPPDHTRIHSGAGMITEQIWENYGKQVSDILPALGTHKAMTPDELKTMFGETPLHLFREHKWREDIVTLGEVPGDYLETVSEGKVNYSWPVQINKLLNEASNKLIVSVGQVVPHEVIGMANYNKNIFVGCGGAEGIHKSHFLGAVYGMERIMGKAHNPVREVLNFGESAFASHLNILYILTVVGKDEKGKNSIMGLYIGDDPECFYLASDHSSKINFTSFDKALSKVLVNLDPSEFKSTWLGNKAIYRTRMAMADKGELIILAPGVESFGEDPQIDILIRKYGYKTTPEILKLVEQNKDLKDNLSVAAHLIHGSSENRFKVIYATEKLSKNEIENVGFSWSSIDEVKEKYNTSDLVDGFNILADGEEIFYISNPALGLWAHKDRLS